MKCILTEIICEIPNTEETCSFVTETPMYHGKLNNVLRHTIIRSELQGTLEEFNANYDEM
jgi:hypothetical protein